MKIWKKLLLAAVPMTLAFSFSAFAAQWEQNDAGWWFKNDDGSYPANGWYWLDGNQDGISECYYFDQNGYLVTGPTQIDGYLVNSDGAWISEDGVVEHLPNESANTGNSAVDVYLAAQAKNRELTSMESNAHYLINMSADGISMDMGMDLNFKMKNLDDPANIQFLAAGNMNALGSNMPVSMFYKDGKYYMDLQGMKMVQSMPLEEAVADVMSNTEQTDITMMSDIQMRTEGENTIISYTVDRDGMNDLLSLSADTYEQSGFSVNYNVRSAYGEAVINKDGHYVREKVVIDMDFTISDAATGEASSVTYKMDLTMDIVNPGQPVDFELPSTEGYTSIDE